jgi:putative RecB family exonuclease
MPPQSVRVTVADTGDALPSHVSASQLGSYRGCALRYYFESILGWRQPESAWTTLGTLLHDTAEELYRLPGDQRTRERAEQLLIAVARTMFANPTYLPYARDDDIRHRAEQGLNILFEIDQPATVVVACDDLESSLSVDLDGVAFTGRLDRRTRQPAGRICDYKSGKRPPPYLLAGKLTQLYLYAAAAQASGDPVDEVELLFLGGDGGRVRRPVYPAALDAAVAELTGMRSASERDLAKHRFTASPGPLCGFCPFKPVCPAHRTSAAQPGSDDSNTTLAQAGLARRGHIPAPVEAVDSVERDLDDEDIW